VRGLVRRAALGLGVLCAGLTVFLNVNPRLRERRMLAALPAPAPVFPRYVDSATAQA